MIFVQHMTNSYPVDRTFLKQLKALPGKPKLVVWEGDALREIHQNARRQL